MPPLTAASFIATCAQRLVGLSIRCHQALGAEAVSNPSPEPPCLEEAAGAHPQGESTSVPSTGCELAPVGAREPTLSRKSVAWSAWVRSERESSGMA
jgi:hypothetical protein